MKVALVRALAFKTRTAGVRGGGSGVPTGGVNGFWTQPVEVALAQGKTGDAACAIGSAPFQFSTIADGVEVQIFAGCSLNTAWPPSALESTPRLTFVPTRPPATSLKSNSMPSRERLLIMELSKSQENFSVNPSGFKSGSKERSVCSQSWPNWPPVSLIHLAAC